RAAGFDLQEAGVTLLDLLACVPDVGDVDRGLDHPLCELEHHSDPALHVCGAETTAAVALDDRPVISVRRHGVEMACDKQPARAPERCSRDDIVPDPSYLEVLGAPERLRHESGHPALVVADRWDVDERCGESEEVR